MYSTGGKGINKENRKWKQKKAKEDKLQAPTADLK